jgi:hypothetical protein
VKPLEGVKVGDRLFIESRESQGLDVVAEITKAGNIKTEKNGIFTVDGRKRGESSSWTFTRARVATAMDIEALRVKRKASMIVTEHSIGVLLPRLI